MKPEQSAELAAVVDKQGDREQTDPEDGARGNFAFLPSRRPTNASVAKTCNRL
jgi:hypothetical protein